jgi:hypothetical protein
MLLSYAILPYPFPISKGIASGTVGTFLPLIVFSIMTLYMCPVVVAGKSFKLENEAAKGEKEKDRKQRDRVHPTEAYRGDDDVSEEATPVSATKAFIGDKHGDSTIEELEWRISHVSKALDELKVAVEKLKMKKEAVPLK